MEVEEFYCSHCGYEDQNIRVAFSATKANGDFGYCPKCGKEVSIEEKKRCLTSVEPDTTGTHKADSDCGAG